MAVEIDYRTPRLAPRECILEESAEFAMLTFPMLPGWASTIGILWAFAAASIHTAVLAFPVYLLTHFHATSGVPIVSGFAKLIVLQALQSLFWWIAAFYWLFEYRRWGHLQNTLLVDPRQVIWSRRGWWGLRTRTYPANDVADIIVIPVKDILGRKTTWKLRFTFQTRRSRRWIIKSRDPGFGERTAMAFRRVLGLAGAASATSP